MKTSILVVLLMATLALSAAEEEGSGEVTTPSAGSGYRFYGQNEMLKPRPARWQSPIKTRAWIGGSPSAIRPGLSDKDPDYFLKLFNRLDSVGRR